MKNRAITKRKNTLKRNALIRNGAMAKRENARYWLFSQANILCERLHCVEGELDDDAQRALAIMEFSVNHLDGKAVYSHSADLLNYITEIRKKHDFIDTAATYFEKVIADYERYK